VNEQLAPLRLWHGGAPGRRVGDWLLPPTVTGIPSTVRQMSVEAGMPEISQREDRVYLTADRELARAWAGIWTPDGANHGGGSLYRVETDALEPDDDLLSLPGVSFQAERARVLAVYDAHVAYHPKFSRILQRVLADHAAAKSAREDER
jgi:hypothetical protein